MHELPSRRESVTQKLGIVHAGGRASLYITSSLDPGGRIQEVFISVEKTGADERAYVDVASRYGTISDELNELHEYPALSQLPEEYNWGIAVIVEEGRAAGPDNNDNNIMFELVPAVKVKGGTE